MLGGIMIFFLKAKRPMYDDC